MSTRCSSSVVRTFSFLLALAVSGYAGGWLPASLAAADESATAVEEKEAAAEKDADRADDQKDSEAKDSAASKVGAGKEPDEKEAASKSDGVTKSDAAKEASKDKATSDASDKETTTAKETASDNKATAAKDSTGAAATAKSTTSARSAAPARKRVRLAMITIKDDLSETAGQAGLFGETQLDLREIVGRLDRAAKDDTILGIVLDLQNPQLGRGKIEELRAAIARFRSAGKKVYAQLESAMPSDYLIAAACDEIVMPETGVVILPGIHAEAMFFKGLLAKVGIQADFIHIGDYKGAAEPLTNDKFSEPVRENMTELIDSLYDEMVTVIVKNRPLSIAQARDVIDTGLLSAKRAKELGLIDRVAYPQELRDELSKSYKAEPLVYVKNYGQKKVDTDFSGPMGFFKLMQAMMGTDSTTNRAAGKKIAIVYAIGPITSGESESDPFGGQTMGSTTIIEALRKANDDKDVAAIVLRIDSPGGSALASDLIWRETQVIKKPIVASMGDVAASGGYYIAMGADKIIAAPGTVTGSIGVVGGKLAVRGLYDKLGITVETIERGRNSGLFSGSGRFTDSQREAVRLLMEETYEQFTSKAAEGRNMPLEKLQELAGGRIYTGRQAKEKGLVDQLGTLHDAITEAKLLAGLDRDAEVKLKVLPEPTNFFESLFGAMDAEEEVQIGRGLDLVAPEMMEVVRRAHRLRRVFDQPAALVMPFELEIR